MKRPQIVHVAPFDYTIVWEDPDIDEEGEWQWGKTDTQDLEITLPDNTNDKKTAQVFLHELLHAISEERGLFRGVVPSEEHIVEILSTGILQFVIDNPDTVKWLTGLARAKE